MTNRARILRSLALCGSLLAATAQGQETAGQTVAGLEEIVVTAQKRSENVQSVPISIIAVSGETLERNGVMTLDALQRMTPGVSMSTVGSGFVSYTYIRGGGTNVIDAGSDPSVAVFVDEVYQAGTTGLQSNLIDIDRIEVLKGPQGTLFGRNAAVGAINVVTKRPSDQFGGYIEGDVGNYGAHALRGAVTGPLSDDGTWRYRLAVGYRDRDAFTENPGGLDPGFVETYTARAQIERASESFNFLLSGEYFGFDNGMTNQYLATDIVAGFITPESAATLPPDQSMFRRYYNDNDGYERQDTGSVTARLEWETGIGTITSISAYRAMNFRRLQDQDGSAADGHALITHEKVDTFSQELRLSGQRDRWRWVTGLYYFDASTDRVDVQDAGADFPNPVARNTAGTYHQNIDTTSYAVFGQATLDLADRWSLTLGGRYSKDEKESNVQNDPLGPSGEFTARLSPSWDSFDPAAVLEFQATDRLMFYGSYRQGYKSGGFQTFASTPALAGTPFDPEHVEAYELGMKSAWLDNRLQFNLAAFIVDIKDQQIQRIPTAGIAIIDNAGRTETRGVDVSLAAAPMERLRIDANATFQRARFEEYVTAGVSFADNHQLRSPDRSFSLGAEYEIPAGSAGDVILRGDYSYQSRVYFDAANSTAENTYQPGYGLLNARLILAMRNNWEFAIWGQNLTNERYFRNIAVVAGAGLAVPGDPRTYGITVSWRAD